MKTVDYRQNLIKRLKSSEYALKLLQRSFDESCRDGNWEAFGITLRDVLEAQGNKRAFARKAGVSRQHLYRLFKTNSNPTIKTLLSFLGVLGLRLTLEVEESRAA